MDGGTGQLVLAYYGELPLLPHLAFDGLTEANNEQIAAGEADEVRKVRYGQRGGIEFHNAAFARVACVDP